MGELLDTLSASPRRSPLAGAQQAVAQSVSARPAVAQPASAQSVSAQPAVAQPASAQPASVQSVSAQPALEATSQPALTLPDSGVADRLDALMSWAARVAEAPAVFVADEQGLTLSAVGVSDAIVSVVGPLMGAISNARTVPGVQGRFGSIGLESHTLSWADAATKLGTFCIGVVSQQPLSKALMEQLADALRETLGSPEPEADSPAPSAAADESEPPRG